MRRPLLSKRKRMYLEKLSQPSTRLLTKISQGRVWYNAGKALDVLQRLEGEGCEIQMAERKRQLLPGLLVQDNQPLIGIPFEENGQEGVRYFTDEKAADAAVSDSTTQAALSVIGAWSDMDWEEMVEALDRIRHESKPTPPIEL